MTELQWMDDYGYLSADPTGVYDLGYFEKYLGYSGTVMAEKLTEARLTMVRRQVASRELVDIGIGGGQFVEAAGCFGYDVNPHAIRWLLDRRLWRDPYFMPVKNATCWDSLEHMDRPDLFLERVLEHVFVSIPIFTGIDHVLRSKHFRPKEHFWYFTRNGFVRWMKKNGFRLIDENDEETKLGRETIGSFTFRREPWTSVSSR